MCTGAEAVLIGGALASAAGTAASTVSAKKRQDAQTKAANNATQATLARNQKLAEESRAAFDARLNREQDGTLQEQANPLANARTDLSNDLIATTNTSAPIKGSAPKVVKDAAAAETARVDNESRSRSEALARARSFGDLLFGKNLQTQDAARDVGVIGNFANANAALLPSQQQLAILGASDTGSGLDLLGQGLQVVGGLGTAAGGAGALDGVFGLSAAPKRSPVPIRRPTTGF